MRDVGICSLFAHVYVRFVRWAFARFYGEFAWTYNTVASLVSAGRWQSWTLVVVPYVRGRVLELGCGTGYVQRALAGRADGSLVVGLDRSPQMLARAHQTLVRAGCLVRLLRADARMLPFPSAAFDTVVATFPSEYIVDRATLAEVRRTLCSRGRLVVVLAAAFGRPGLYARLVDLAYRLTLQGRPSRASAVLPRSLLGCAMEQAGFVVEELWVTLEQSVVHLVIGDVQ